MRGSGYHNTTTKKQRKYQSLQEEMTRVKKFHFTNTVHVHVGLKKAVSQCGILLTETQHTKLSNTTIRNVPLKKLASRKGHKEKRGLE